jgi:hypothetical protein
MPGAAQSEDLRHAAGGLPKPAPRRLPLRPQGSSDVEQIEGLSDAGYSAFELVNMAREYNAALSACRFLGVPSPEAVKAWPSGNAFWSAFEVYRVQCARLGLSPLPSGCESPRPGCSCCDFFHLA